MKKVIIIASLVGAVSLAAGVGIGLLVAPTPDPTQSTAYKNVSNLVDGYVSQIAAANRIHWQDAATISKDAGLIKNLPAEQAALKAQQAQLRQREQVVNAQYNRISQNDLSGDGVYLAGTDMAPGTYRTSGQQGCYWAVTTDANSQNIVANGNVDGPAFATVQRGQYLTLQGCADWILQR